MRFLILLASIALVVVLVLTLGGRGARPAARAEGPAGGEAAPRATTDLVAASKQGGRDAAQESEPTVAGPSVAEPEARNPAPPTGLAAASPALRGRVLDDLGVPVEGAKIEVSRRTIDAGGFGLRSETSVHLKEFDTHSGENGLFTIQPAPEGEVLLEASMPNYAQKEAVTATAPAEGLLLTLSLVGAIEITLADPKDPLAKRVNVEVERSRAEPAAPPWTRHAGVSRFRRGRILRKELLPGDYDVRIRSRSGGPVLFQVGPVRVTAGEVTRDPRLTDISLASRISPVTLTVVDLEDEPIPKAEIWIHEGSGEVGLWTDSEGGITFLVGESGLDLRIEHPGYRPRELRGVRDDTRVQLEEALRLRLRRTFSEPGLSLYISHEAGRGTPEHLPDMNLEFPPGETEILGELGGPGIYSVQWSVMIQGPAGATAMLNDFAHIEPQTFEVKEGESEVVVDLEVDPEQVARIELLAQERLRGLEREENESDASYRRRWFQAVTGRER